MDNPTLVSFVRLQRQSTDSYLTFALPINMTYDEVDMWAYEIMPGWEVIHCTAFNPDGDAKQ